MCKKPLLALMAAVTLACSVNAMADSVMNKAGDAVDWAGKAISETGDKVGQVISETGDKIGAATSQAAVEIDKYVDDGTITAKVKKALADISLSTSFDVSVTTNDGVVTLTGFVPGVESQLAAVKAASEVDGVKSVSDKLNIRDAKEITVKDYANDSLITSEVKAKLLTTDDLPIIGIKVETVNGVVQLSGKVSTFEQAYNAEQVAKQVDGVKTVKNDLTVAP